MKEQDFNNLFKKSSETTRPFEIPEGDWDALHSRLDAHDEGQASSASKWLSWLPWFFIGGLMISHVFLYKSLLDTNQSNNELIEQLTDLKETLQTQNTVYVHDTIYLNEAGLSQISSSSNGENTSSPIQENGGTNPFTNNSNSISTLRNSNLNSTNYQLFNSNFNGINSQLFTHKNTITNSVIGQSNNTNFSSKNNNSFIQKNTISNSFNEQSNKTKTTDNKSFIQNGNTKTRNNISNNSVTKKSTTPFLFLDSLASLKANELDIKDAPFSIPTFSTIQTKKKRHISKKILQGFTPTGFELSINTGFSAPFKENIEGQSGITTGLKGAILFSDNLRLWVEGSYTYTQFEIDEFDESLGFPERESPDEDYEFYYGEVMQSSMNYTAGMSYIFMPQKIFSPYVGLGYGGSTRFPTQLNYNFNDEDNSGGGNNDDDDIKIETKLDEIVKFKHIGQANIGLRFAPKQSKFGGYLEGTYRHQFNPNSVQIMPDFIGIQLGAFYQF